MAGVTKHISSKMGTFPKGERSRKGGKMLIIQKRCDTKFGKCQDRMKIEKVKLELAKYIKTSNTRLSLEHLLFLFLPLCR